MPAFIWEKLDCKNQPVGGLGAWRAKIPGGWFVAIQTRQSLFNDLQTLINEEFDGKLQLSYTSAFHVAQKG